MSERNSAKCKRKISGHNYNQNLPVKVRENLLTYMNKLNLKVESKYPDRIFTSLL